jgi:hypothetical protein
VNVSFEAIETAVMAPSGATVEVAVHVLGR